MENISPAHILQVKLSEGSLTSNGKLRGSALRKLQLFECFSWILIFISTWRELSWQLTGCPILVYWGFNQQFIKWTRFLSANSVHLFVVHSNISFFCTYFDLDIYFGGSIVCQSLMIYQGFSSSFWFVNNTLFRNKVNFLFIFFCNPVFLCL